MFLSSIKNIPTVIKEFFSPSSKYESKIAEYTSLISNLEHTDKADLIRLFGEVKELTATYCASFGKLELFFNKNRINQRVLSLLSLESKIFTQIRKIELDAEESRLAEEARKVEVVRAAEEGRQRAEAERVAALPPPPRPFGKKAEPSTVAARAERNVHFAEEIPASSSSSSSSAPDVRLQRSVTSYRLNLSGSREFNRRSEETVRPLIDDVEADMTEKDMEISKDFYFKDQWLGRDVIQCINVVPWMIDLMEDRKKDLDNIGKTSSGNHSALNNVKQKQQHDKYHRPTKANWYDSRYFRDLLASHPEKTYEEIVRLYSPGPINFRFQYVETTEGIQEWFRIGVITDLTNGWTNLRELGEIADDKTGAKLEKKVCKLAQVRNEYEKKGKEGERVVQALDYALKELLGGDIRTVGSRAESIRILHTKTRGMLRKKEEKEGARATLNEMLNTRQVTNAIEKTIDKRKKILRDQMNMLCISQMLAHQDDIAKLQDGSAYTFAHVGLLNEKNHSIDPTGWAHFEDNEMLDMYQIFKEFKGVSVVFDAGLEKPRIDADGVIHMPKSPDGPSQINLNPIFFNTSVQGNTKNTKIQREINNEGLADLQKIGITPANNPDIKKAADGLKGNNSNYDIATYLASGLLKARIAISIGCLSAKDRTGFVCEFLARCAIKAVVKASNAKGILGKFKKSSYIDELNNGVLSKDNNAAKVIEQCTGADVIKSTAPLVGLSVNPVNPFRRLGYYFNQLAIAEPLA